VSSIVGGFDIHRKQLTSGYLDTVTGEVTRGQIAPADRADARLLRDLLAQGRLPECWIPPEHILECRALLECYHDLRAEHTVWTFSWRRRVRRRSSPAFAQLRG
jgi:hypothetical protein